MEQGVVPPTINLEEPAAISTMCQMWPTTILPAADIPKAILSDNLGFGEWP